MVIDLVFAFSCCGWSGGKFCVFCVLFLLLYHADEITGSSTLLEAFCNNLEKKKEKDIQQTGIINVNKYHKFCKIYLIITKSRKIFIIFMKAPGISSTRGSFSISVFVFPIPCVFVGPTTEKLYNIKYNMYCDI